MTTIPPPRIDHVRWLPLSTLVVALATVFVVAGDRSQFYRAANHDYATAKVLAITENLSAEHGFRLFKRIYPGPAGAVRYEMYSRFPLASYLLVKIAIAPAGDDLQAKILMARVLMLTLFCAAAILLYCSLARLAKSRWIALVATLPAFSSQYLLYFADAVDTETSVDLFGMMLAFHGIVVFVLHGRFRQLLAKAGAALLLGWHVVGLLLVFVVLGVARELASAERGSGMSAVGRRGWQAVFGTLARSRCLLLGLFTVLGVGVVAGVNFAVEYFALGGNVPLAQTPSLRSVLQKAGLANGGDFFQPLRDQLAWHTFLASQMHRVGGVVLPSFLSAPLCSVDSMSAPHPVLVAVGAVATALCVVGLVRLWRVGGREHLVLPLGALAFSGFGWAVPLRNMTAAFSHEQHGMFYLGVVPALVVFAALVVPWRHRVKSAAAARVRVVAVALAVAVFVSSSAQMAHVGKRTSGYQDEVFADFQAIRERTRGAKVFVVATGSPRRYLGARLGMEFFLARRIWQYSDRREESYREIALGEDGSVWQSPPWEGDGAPDFVVARDRFDIPALLTPGNGTAFLYDSLPALADAYRGMPLLDTAPVARAKFDVHVKRRAAVEGGGNEEHAVSTTVRWPWRSARAEHELAYFKEPCVEDDFQERFFLHVLPVVAEDLPSRARDAGFEGLDFDFLQHGVRLAGMCVATLRLPDYPVDRVRTGQLAAGTGERSWEVEFALSGRAEGVAAPRSP